MKQRILGIMINFMRNFEKSKLSDIEYKTIRIDKKQSKVI